MRSSLPEFSELVAHYKNTAENNDELHNLLTELTWSSPILTAHRRHCEAHKLGFGDAAFHSLWAILLPEAARRFTSVRALEIGVFKGQIISLWSLIARECRLNVTVSAVTPLQGKAMPRSRALRKLLAWTSPQFREDMRSGNFYGDSDYRKSIGDLYRYFDLDFLEVELHQGYSTDLFVLNRLASQTFHIVYVDGDHSYEGALHDFTHYGPKVEKGGWLIADDAACDLPGTRFWKGHEAVSRAAQIIPSLGFKNVLNVGHNRVYERI